MRAGSATDSPATSGSGSPRRRPGAAFAARLLGWYDRERRDLPWRRTRDPWAIWVSEVMLQQTRVEAVRDAYVEFMARFPRPDDFAAASDDELHAAWRGLGYYRRARLLREGARRVCAEHGGRLPADPDALGRLPGIGSYTRGALASIAFGRPEPAVDGNVERVVARHRCLDAAPATAAARRQILAAVAGWIEPDRPGDFNQALMELGATVCLPRRPRCAACPVAEDCLARRLGRTEELPRRKPRPEPVVVATCVVVCRAGPGVLAHRVPDGEPNAGQLELPGPGVLRSLDAADLPALLRQRFGASIEVGAAVATAAHAITRHRIRVVAYLGVASRRGDLEAHPVMAPAAPWTTISRKLLLACGLSGAAQSVAVAARDAGRRSR